MTNLGGMQFECRMCVMQIKQLYFFTEVIDQYLDCKLRINKS